MSHLNSNPMIIKILKTLGMITIVGILVVVSFILIFWGIVNYGRYSKKREAISYQKEVCDTIKTIDNGFAVQPMGFKPKEVKTVLFQLLRDGKVRQEKSIAITPKMIRENENIVIPFKSFLRNDTIAVAINNRLYLLNGIDFIASHNWGMFGPVGSCFCESTGFRKINGKEVSTPYNQLRKDEGNIKLSSKK